MVAPFAPQYLDEFRRAGHQLVLATTTPVDMITPFAEAMGFDDVIATTYETNEDGRYTGRLFEGFVWGTGKLKAVRAWAGGSRHRPGRVPCLQRQRLRYAPALLGRLAPRRQSRPGPHPHRDGPALAHRPLGPPAGRAVPGRTRAVSPDPPVRPAGVVPLRPLRHRRDRAHPVVRARLVGRQPPQLLRRGGARPRRRQNRSSGALPRQEGDVRRPGRGDRWPGPSAASRSTGAAVRTSRCAPPRRRCAPAKWSSSCPRAPSHGARPSSTPSSTARPARPAWPRPPGAPVVPDRPVGHRGGVAPLGPGARRHAGPPPADRSPSGSVNRSRSRGTDAVAGHHRHHVGHFRLASRGVEGAPPADGRGAGAHQASFVTFGRS